MKEVTIFRQIPVQQQMTEQAKKEQMNQLRQALQEVDQQIQQMRQQRDSVLRQHTIRGADQGSLQKLRQQLDEACREYYVQRDQLMLQLDETSQLQAGQEISLGVIEGPKTLQVGQPFQLTEAQLVVKDGVVTAIREK